MFSALQNTTEKMPEIVHIASMTVSRDFEINGQKIPTFIDALVNNSRHQWESSFTGIKIEMSVSKENVAITITHVSDSEKPKKCLDFINTVIQTRFKAFKNKIEKSTCSTSV